MPEKPRLIVRQSDPIIQLEAQTRPLFTGQLRTPVPWAMWRDRQTGWSGIQVEVVITHRLSQPVPINQSLQCLLKMKRKIKSQGFWFFVSPHQQSSCPVGCMLHNQHTLPPTKSLPANQPACQAARAGVWTQGTASPVSWIMRLPLVSD